MAFRRRKYCRFTAEGVKEVDYLDTDKLKLCLGDSGQIVPSHITGTAPKFQRQLAEAVKRARFLALLPFCEHR